MTEVYFVDDAVVDSNELNDELDEEEELFAD